MSEAIDGGSETQEPVTETAKPEAAPAGGEAALLAAKARRDDAEARRQRAAAAFETARAELEAAEAELEAAKAAIEDANAKADAGGGSAKDADASPKLAEDSPKLAAPSPELAEDSPERADPSPKLADPSPKLADPSPKDTEDSPKLAAPSPKDTEDSPKDADASPKLADPSPKLADPSPKLAEDSPKLAEDSPKLAEDSPKLAEDSPKLADPSPKLAEDSPKLADPSTKDAEDSPKLADPSTKLAEDSPKLAEDSPKLAAPSPKDAEDSPKLADASPKLADPSPKLAEDSPKLADASTKLSDPATKDGDTSAKDGDTSANDGDTSANEGDASKDAAEAAPAPAPEPPPPPAIESIDPGHGPLAGGTEVLIMGTGFAEGCEVQFGGVPAKVERNGDTRLVVTVPAGPASGDTEVRVANPDGQADKRDAGFRFHAPPVLTGVEPAVVSVKGGTVVTLLGAELWEGCAVLVDSGSVPAARAHQGRLEVVVSPHAVGTVDVSVRNPDGQRATLAGALRYEEPPFIEDISPNHGLTTGGTEVVITGRHFLSGCAVLFGGEPVEGVRFVSDTEVHLTAPSHAAPEPVHVAVVNPSGISHRLPSAFAYERAAPKIAAVSPESGPNEGGTRLTVTGTDFDGRCAVFVCGIPAKTTWKSRQEIEVVTPTVARDGLVDVRLVNEDDQASVAEKVFRYTAPLLPPVLTAINPTGGSQVGGTKVTLVGEDFADGVKVRFAGIAAEARFVTKKQIEAVAPQYAGAGAVAVEVENPDGVTSALENAFTYEARPAPSITSVSPPNGPTTGGTKIVIEGVNFTKDCQVYVGREYPKDQLVKSATEIHAVVAPRKMAGVVDVEVAAPGLPKAVAKNGFRYDAVPPPAITSIAPNAGSVAGGTEMSITGKNFRKDSIVLIDGKPAKTVKFVDPQNLELKTPPGDPNKMVDVIVRNPDGNEALQKRAFLYDPRYR